MPLGVVDKPVALAGQVTIQRVQRGPQLSRRRNGLSCTGLPSEWCMTAWMRSMLTRALVALPFHSRQCRRSTSSMITAFAASRDGLSHDKPPAICPQKCTRKSHSRCETRSRIGAVVTPASARMFRSPEQPSVKAVNSVSPVRPTASRLRLIKTLMSVPAPTT